MFRRGCSRCGIIFWLGINGLCCQFRTYFRCPFQSSCNHRCFGCWRNSSCCCHSLCYHAIIRRWGKITINAQIRDTDCLGIAAAGILRLLLVNHVYDKCTGGATFLTDYKVSNGTYGEVLIDEVHPVQVRTNSIRDEKIRSNANVFLFRAFSLN